MALRTFDVQGYYECCVRHNFFTCGGNSSYNKVFNLIRNGATLNDIALATYVCSEGYTLEEIKKIFRSEVHFM